MDYERNIIKKIRNTISEARKVQDVPRHEEVIEEDNLLNRFKTLMDEAVDANSQDDGQAYMVITRNDVQFGSVRSAQEDAIRKTVGDVLLKDDALKYYPKIDDVVFNGEISGLGVTFQFRYKDPSGDGCYIWTDGLQLTDSNSRTIEKIRDAFLNWKDSIAQDGDLMQKLAHKAASE